MEKAKPTQKSSLLLSKAGETHPSDDDDDSSEPILQANLSGAKVSIDRVGIVLPTTAKESHPARSQPTLYHSSV